MLKDRIFELRTAAGYTQVALAKILGVSKQAVSNWENDNIQPSIDMLVRLADTFNVTTDYLLGREDAIRLSTEGLDEEAIAHISMLLNDLRQRRNDAMPVTGGEEKK